MPVAYVIHRVCEEFGVLPHVAARALETDTGLLADVLDVRAFVRAYQALETYERSDGQVAAPTLTRALRDRLLGARAARLLALKAERDG